MAAANISSWRGLGVGGGAACCVETQVFRETGRRSRQHAEPNFILFGGLSLKDHLPLVSRTSTRIPSISASKASHGNSLAAGGPMFGVGSG